jgi:hypothetical protein
MRCGWPIRAMSQMRDTQPTEVNDVKGQRLCDVL